MTEMFQTVDFIHDIIDICIAVVVCVINLYEYYKEKHKPKHVNHYETLKK